VKVTKKEAAKLSPPDTEESDAEVSSSEDSDW
jgi:hypothetical protein